MVSVLYMCPSEDGYGGQISKTRQFSQNLNGGVLY